LNERIKESTKKFEAICEFVSQENKEINITLKSNEILNDKCKVIRTTQELIFYKE